MATRGWALRTTSELAGVGPADLLRFCRLEAESALALPLARGVALALSLRGGIMLPWGAQPAGGRRPTHIRRAHATKQGLRLSHCLRRSAAHIAHRQLC